MVSTRKAHLIGQSYEATFQGAKTKVRSREGIFYTPPSLARYTVSKALGHWIIKNPGKLPAIMDPACGSGAFLIEAAEWLLAETRFKPTDLLLCGVDKDSQAVEATSEALKTIQSEIIPRIVHGNSLISKTPDTNIDSLSPVDWEEHFPFLSHNGGFDLVIANPPYGISRGEKFHPLEKRIIEDRYDWIRSGKLNKYIAFIGLSYELLRPGGIAALIIPNSWLGIDSGKKLREFLLRSKILKEIVVLPQDAFADPSVETVILILEKDSCCDFFEINKLKDIKNSLIESKTIVSTSECLNLPAAIIPLNLNKESSELINQINNSSFALGGDDSPFQPRIAIQAYAIGKGSPPQTESDVKDRVFDTTDRNDSDAIPYLDSKDVHPLRIDWSGNYLKYGPWLAEPQTIKRFEGPRILVREILGKSASPIIAAYTDKLFLYNKSILHIIPRSPAAQETEMLALLGILSSNVATLLINTLGRKSQRKLFPKLVLADLNSFPIPQSFNANSATIAQLTRKAIESSGEQRNSALLVLNELICQIYGISNHQVNSIIHK